jgi:hypothetical protein
MTNRFKIIKAALYSKKIRINKNNLHKWIDLKIKMNCQAPKALLFSSKIADLNKRAC